MSISTTFKSSRNNRPPGRFDHGWKDTIDVAPAEAVEVIVRFTDYRGTYLVHCHTSSTTTWR